MDPIKSINRKFLPFEIKVPKKNTMAKDKTQQDFEWPASSQKKSAYLLP